MTDALTALVSLMQVFGIIGIVVCLIIAGIVAWVMYRTIERD